MNAGTPPQPLCLSRSRSQLLVVDIQTRLSPAMAPDNTVLARAGILLQSAEILKVPVIFSEQYPKGLGTTELKLTALAPSARIFEKIEFSCARNPELAGALAAHIDAGRDQIVICGIEAHVCVAQTALDLASAGRQVFVVADAVASRRTRDRKCALARFRDNGIGVVTSEMVAFEWLEKAGTDAFKAVLALIKPL